jgi:transmembrane sensor
MKKELNYNHNIDELLVKSMLDEATVAEQIEISQWLLDSEANQQYFEHFELIWTQSKQLALHSQVDEETAWQRFRKRTRQAEVETPVIPLHQKPAFRLFRVAAMLVLLLGAAWLAYFYTARFTGKDQVVIASGAETLTDTLPDGSVVVLNKKSTLSYPQDFRGNTRKVAMTGEAFFQVVPDKSKPFIISVNDVTVKVVGTSFNVKDTGKKTEVIVETGLVEVTRKHEKVRLIPKQKVTALKSGPDLVKQNTEDDFYKYYRTKKLVCDGTPLWRLVETLNEVYDADIVIENETLRDLPINSTFDHEPLNNILDLISETLTLKVEHQEQHIILK